MPCNHKQVQGGPLREAGQGLPRGRGDYAVESSSCDDDSKVGILAAMAEHEHPDQHVTHEAMKAITKIATVILNDPTESDKARPFTRAS